MQNLTAFTSSANQEWETPQTLFNQLNEEFNFTLDVCALPETAKCEKYYTPLENGLIQDWSNEVCWMNPPYGKFQKEWIYKAHEESLKGTTVVCLIPARPDTKIWHEVIFPNAEVRFIKGRITFVGAKSPAVFPSALVIFGPNAQKSVIKTYTQKRN